MPSCFAHSESFIPNSIADIRLYIRILLTTVGDLMVGRSTLSTSMLSLYILLLWHSAGEPEAQYPLCLSCQRYTYKVCIMCSILALCNYRCYKRTMSLSITIRDILGEIRNELARSALSGRSLQEYLLEKGDNND